MIPVGPSMTERRRAVNDPKVLTKDFLRQVT